MPFDVDFFRNYYLNIKPIVVQFGIECFISIDEVQTGWTLDKIMHMIKKSEYVIVDMSVANSNVMFELGLLWSEILSKRKSKESIILLKRDLENCPCKDMKSMHCWYQRYWNAAEICSDIQGIDYIKHREGKLQDEIAKFLQTAGCKKSIKSKKKHQTTSKLNNTRWTGMWKVEDGTVHEVDLRIGEIGDGRQHTAQITTRKDNNVCKTLKEKMELYCVDDDIMINGIFADDKKYDYDLMHLKIDKQKDILQGVVYSKGNRKGSEITLNKIIKRIK
ncbi:MAG: hypothetical protein EZS26_000044 [Candidatus Ordinivivax streblomastigis]|uniref:Uncharacterized protein n=1 Tax=Candidatus Ordinivivax streblomastigis TaxID=2540710 RepID=A0A5M8P4U1_9BACT|nr:MAG: hypothetical protein EZS26_000044 [Candidatus Ordinivivax streblomastigis]